MKVEGLIFDMNGTMIDDMHFHEEAWYKILNEDMHANMTHEEVKKQMYGKNTELITRLFGDKYSAQEAMDFSTKKELAYQKAFLPHLKFIDGLDHFIQKAKQSQLKLAIGTAALPINVNFVLDNLHIRPLFDVIADANDVSASKPDPAIFLLCAEKLGVSPHACIVFEDTPMGVEAAYRAGMKAVVVTTYHSPEDFDKYDNILLFISDYTDPKLLALLDRGN